MHVELFGIACDEKGIGKITIHKTTFIRKEIFLSPKYILHYVCMCYVN